MLVTIEFIICKLFFFLSCASPIIAGTWDCRSACNWYLEFLILEPSIDAVKESTTQASLIIVWLVILSMIMDHQALHLWLLVVRIW